jgi:DNA-binding protein HU-beta
MNKNELIAAVAGKSDLTKEQAGAAVDATIETISDTLKDGGEVRLLGFGNFLVTHRKATTGRNPQTGEAIQIKATNVPKFKPGKGLKEKVNS